MLWIMGIKHLLVRTIGNSERLSEAGFNASVGSVGDFYDNALAETINRSYKTEVIQKDGPWKGLEQVELATIVFLKNCLDHL